MQDKKLTVEMIEVPSHMLEAFVSARFQEPRTPSEFVRREMEKWLAASLLSLATNPVYLQREVAQEVAHGYSNQYSSLDITKVENAFVQFQRIAFLRKPDPVPEEVKALLFKAKAENMTTYCSTADERILQAYALGKARSNDTM